MFVICVPFLPVRDIGVINAPTERVLVAGGLTAPQVADALPEHVMLKLGMTNPPYMLAHIQSVAEVRECRGILRLNLVWKRRKGMFTKCFNCSCSNEFEDVLKGIPFGNLT